MRRLIEIEVEARSCVACPLAEHRTQVVFGAGNEQADLMFVGEAPGRDEDLQGAPFVGRSGKLLDRLIAEELAIDRTGYYITNVVKCRPPGNRDPQPDEVTECRHYLASQVEHVAPRVIVTLGNFATRALLETPEGITKLRGRVHAYGSIALVPTFHPSAALRGGATVVADMRADLIRAKRALGAP
ncbi:MAG: uracil-DNA glycosylase [Acidimicrobiales bacterium]